MKKILVILLLFPCLIGWGQEYRTLLKSGGKILMFAGQGVAQNQLLIGLKLHLNSSLISIDSLTYNSTGHLVTYANADTVVLDGSLDVVVGNSVRFGSPITGTTCRVLGRLGISDTILIDQVFPGSISDEYYWGGISAWYDNSGNDIVVTQTTAINQPKLLWGGTDSASVYFDGINDYFDFPSTYDLTSTFSVVFDYKRYNYNTLVLLGRSNTNSFSHIYFTGELSFAMESNTNGNNVVGAVTNSLDYNNIIITADNNECQFYENGDSTSMTSTTLTNTLTINRIGTGVSAFYFAGEIKNIYIYNRVLTNEEINALQ